MNRRATRWGIAFPCIAIALAVGAFLLVRNSPTLRHPFYTQFLPWAGSLLALLCFLVGHLSYPRIHNLKVFMAGYLLGLATLAYFVAYAPLPFFRHAAVHTGFRPALYLMILADLVGITLAPSFVKYQTTKIVTWTAAAAEVVVLLLAAATPLADGLVRLRFQAWLAPLLAAGVAALTVRYMRYEFHLGGLLAGSAIMYGFAWAFAWYADFARATEFAVEKLTFALAVAYFETGCIFHWFVRMEHRIAYDPLLHIYNRDYCMRILAEQSRLNASPPFTIAMVDIDHFKRVNDTYGHQAGDQVLYAVAQALSRAVVPAGTLCRYGGEELAVFFPQQDVHHVHGVMEQARLAIQRMEVATSRKRISVTVSCGISSRRESTQTLQQVLAAADRALYRAKQGGRNQVCTGSVRQSRKE